MACMWIEGAEIPIVVPHLAKMLESLIWTVSNLNDGCEERKAQCQSTIRWTVDGVPSVQVLFSTQFKLSPIKILEGFRSYLGIKGRLIN